MAQKLLALCALTFLSNSYSAHLPEYEKTLIRLKSAVQENNLQKASLHYNALKTAHSQVLEGETESLKKIKPGMRWDRLFRGTAELAMSACLFYMSYLSWNSFLNYRSCEPVPEIVRPDFDRLTQESEKSLQQVTVTNLDDSLKRVTTAYDKEIRANISYPILCFVKEALDLKNQIATRALATVGIGSACAGTYAAYYGIKHISKSLPNHYFNSKEYEKNKSDINRLFE